MSKAYYNEFDPKAAAWLRELIKAGLIAEGDVDERSIADVTASDVKGYRQCHWFAGIGGWSLAFRLAGLPDDFEGDSCSCPCQPFSAAGQGKGEKDARDLWPEFFRIARERRAPVAFGEQVENAINKHGWLDRISADLEGCGYAVGAAVLPAASVGAPHMRHRLFWLASATGRGLSKRPREEISREAARNPSDGLRAACWLGNGESRRLGRDRSASGSGGHAQQPSESGWMGEPIQPGLERHAGDGADRNESRRDAAQSNGSTATTSATGGLSDSTGAQLQGLAPAWNECGDGKNHFVLCRDTTSDGAARVRRIPSEPAFFPLADGFSGSRVGLLRGAGNAIVPKAAAEFIQAYREVVEP